MAEHLFDYTIPSLHPFAVHFPLVLLLLGGGIALLWAFTKKIYWFYALWATVTLCLPFNFVAYQSGKNLAQDVDGEPMATLFLAYHEQSAFWLIILTGILWLTCSFLWYQAKQKPQKALLNKQPIQWALVGFAVLLSLLVAYVGHLGGLMVWGVPA